MRPSLRAASRPALVRSLSIARSNSANAPTICIIIRPAGVVVSTASVRLRKPALLQLSQWTRTMSAMVATGAIVETGTDEIAFAEHGPVDDGVLPVPGPACAAG